MVIVLFTLAWIWLGEINTTPNQYAGTMIKNALTMRTNRHVGLDGKHEVLDEYVSGTTAFFDIRTRAVGVQQMFGIGWGEYTVKAKASVAAYWIMALATVAGIIKCTRSSDIDREYKVLLMCFVGVVGIAVIFPFVSVYYGVTRVVTNSLIVTAPAAVIGLRWFAKKAHMSPVVVIGGTLVYYGSCVSGLVPGIILAPIFTAVVLLGLAIK